MSTNHTPLHLLTRVRKPSRGDDESGQPPPDGSGVLTSLEFARQLVALGAHVNAPLSKGSHSKLSLVGATPFFLAAKNADLPLMKLLVELGADPLRANKDGATPLMAAAGLGCAAAGEEAGSEAECLEAVTYLRSLGAEVNTIDANKETAMHGAAYKNQPKIVQWLADHGAKVELWNHKNKFGWTPLLIAEGFRPGNFKPSAETIAALHKVMIDAGVSPPPPTLRPDPSLGPKGYEAAEKKADNQKQ
jgi:ankyrin repeat protein